MASTYLTYLGIVLPLRDLLHESGSIFVQIGDENVHRVRALLDEVFGEENFISQISFKTSVPLGSTFIWHSKLPSFLRNKKQLKFRESLRKKQKERGLLRPFVWRMVR